MMGIEIRESDLEFVCPKCGALCDINIRMYLSDKEICIPCFREMYGEKVIVDENI